MRCVLSSGLAISKEGGVTTLLHLRPARNRWARLLQRQKHACIVCQTARALGTPTPRKVRRAPREYVREAHTGIRGYVLRRVWRGDVLSYVVRFDDGREKRVMPSEVKKEGTQI
jgi:hypothetical protein